ncbi:MAG: metallophosphoesterase [Candidatus Zixiibacteriota bacterium]
MSWFLIRLALMIAALGAAQVLMMRYFNRPWWEVKWVRWLSLGWPVAAIVSVLLWKWTFPLLASAALLVGLVAAVITLPFAGLLNFADWLYPRLRLDWLRRGRRTATVSPAPIAEGIHEAPQSASRRSFLKYGAALAPALAVGGSISGVARSFNQVRVFHKDLYFPDLPAELDGFRILQLCDLHLGVFYNLSDLEELIDRLAAESYDLVALIGDVADDLNALPDALKMIASLKSTYGHLATLGNHEYYRGVQAVYFHFARSDINLLVNQGVNLNVGGRSVYVGGADDPATISWREDRTVFFRHSLEKAMDDAPTDSFKLLMTHRPSAFKVASVENIDLSLAGHTHGGQFGLMGHSLIDMLGDDLYVWGHFSQGESQLYTSSGVGHWFPFRLGCPAEAPIFTLRRA